MSAGRKILVYILLGCYAVFNTGFTVDALVWAPATNTNLDIQLQVSQWNFAVHLPTKSSTNISINLTNIGDTTWQTDEIYLAGILPTKTINYPFVLTTQPNWSDGTKTLSRIRDVKVVVPGESFNFILPIKAPEQPGWYRMYLQPIIHNSPINRLVRIDLEIGQTPKKLAISVVKHIDVSIADQTADLYEGQYNLAHFDVSTGRPGMDTPPGTYTVTKKYLDVWSNFAEMQLPYWLELRNEAGVFDGYGIHGVPYHNVVSDNYIEGKTYDGFKYYTNGKLYEGYDFIGKAFTQGCIVFSLSNAEMIYDWAEIDKTIVHIQ